MEKIENWFYQNLEETTSTNDAVQEFLKKVRSPCILTANCQTGGRGRLGRQWQSLKGNLFASFAYQINLRNLKHMVILSGLAVAETVQYFLPSQIVEVKWPNDVLVDNKKISGILFEKSFDDYWVMGIGINVCHTPILQNALYQATSFADFGILCDRKEVLKILVKKFDFLKEQYEKEGFFSIKKTWLDKAYNRGKKINIQQNGKIKEGIFQDLSDDGDLILKTSNGCEKIIVGDLFV